MSRASLLTGAVLWGTVLVAVIFVWQSKQEPDAEVAEPFLQPSGGAQAEESDDDGAASSVKISFPARPLPEFEFDEVMGEKLGLSDLLGKRWVASFVFSRCTMTCPTISAAVMRVHEHPQVQAEGVGCGVRHVYCRSGLRHR